MRKNKGTQTTARKQTQARAPKGGCTINGTFYVGGRLLPTGIKIVDRKAAARKAWQTRLANSAFSASASAQKAWETRRAGKAVVNG